MGGQLGDSTRRRMAADLAGGGPMGGTRSGFNPGASIGGYAGGMGGTFGRSARGLTPGEAAGATSPKGGARPASAGPGGPCPSPFPYDAPASAGGGWGGPNEASQADAGKRDKVRPASGAVRSAWHDAAQKTPPRAPPPGTTNTAVKMRPQSATKRTPLGVEPVEYRLEGQGLQAVQSSTRPMSALPYSRGNATSSPAPTSMVGTRPPISRHPYAIAKRSGGASSPRGTVGTTRGGGGGGGGGRPLAPQLVAAQRQLDELRADEAEDATLSPSGGEGRELSEAHILALEDAIRDALRAKRSIYEGSKEMLVKLFKSVDDGSGDVSIEEFSAVCNEIGVVVSPKEAQGLFNRYGYDNVMPYERFAHYLLTQPARQLAEDMPTKKGAFQPGQSAHFNGKILYKPCRKPVYTPSDWDPSLAERSSELPNARLVLDFIYGYQGKSNTAQNLFYTSEGKCVFYTAGVGIVYQRPPVHHQYFFLGHSDDITAIALCPATVDHEGKQYPPKTLVATGQVTSTDGPAYICIWDSRLGSDAPMGSDSVAVASEVARIEMDKGDKGFCALAFSPTGNRLVVVAMDTGHSVYIYDWRKKRQVGGGRGHMGDPPQVYGVEWNPYEISHSVPSAFLQFGKKHLRLWSDPGGGAWSSKALSFGKLQMRHVMSAQWLPPRAGGTECLVAAGTDDGQIYLFKGGTAIRAIAAHRPGPKFIREDGHPGYSGVRGLRSIKGGTVLLSGGADGTVLQWDTSDGSIQESRFSGSPLQLKSPFGPGDKNAPAIRSLDYSEELDKVLVGTINCDISELSLDGSSDVPLMDGHSGDIYHIAFHPKEPNVFATVSDSGHAHLWDSSIRQMTHCVPLGWAPRAVAFSPITLSQSRGAGGKGGYHVAVGAQTGQIKILDEGQNLRPIHEMKDSKEGIADLKYSPNGKMLAASTNDTMIDVYSVERGYQRIARCHGHSATVRGIDWNVDSSVIMSNSNDFELLYWNARTGKQMTMGIRDLEMATFTSLLGFQVMGIWPPYVDGLDINSLDRSKNKQWCVTSDDHGMVKMFAYPCVVHDAPHRAYRGHSSHVISVRFNSNDSLVCTAGGHDWAVFQFRVVELKPEDPPPPPPEKVWGPIDSSGRNYGWTQPAPLSPTPASGPGGPSGGGRPPPPPPPPPPSSPPTASLVPAAEVGYERPRRDVAPLDVRGSAPRQQLHTDDEVIDSPGGAGLASSYRFDPNGGVNGDEDEFEGDFDQEGQQPLDEGREFQAHEPLAADQEEMRAPPPPPPSPPLAPRAGRRAAPTQFVEEVEDEF